MKNIVLFVVLCAVTVLVAAGCKPAEPTTPPASTNAPATAPSTTTTNQ